MRRTQSQQHKKRLFLLRMLLHSINRQIHKPSIPKPLNPFRLRGVAKVPSIIVLVIKIVTRPIGIKAHPIRSRRRKSVLNRIMVPSFRRP